MEQKRQNLNNFSETFKNAHPIIITIIIMMIIIINNNIIIILLQFSNVPSNIECEKTHIFHSRRLDLFTLECSEVANGPRDHGLALVIGGLQNHLPVGNAHDIVTPDAVSLRQRCQPCAYKIT